MNDFKALLVLMALVSIPVLSANHISENVVRARIAGIDVIVYRTAVKNVVTLMGSLRAGDAVVGSGNITLPTLTGMMLDRGTLHQDQFAIAQQLESVGASIQFEVGPQMLNVQAHALRKDLPMVIGLLADQLRAPAFSAEEFEKARQQFEGIVEQSTVNTEYRAAESFSRLAYPPGHPNRLYSVDEYRVALKSVTIDDLKAYHHAHYGPSHMTLVLVGDVDAAQVRLEIEKAFAGWNTEEAAIGVAPVGQQPASQTQIVQVAGKTSVSILIGAPTGLQYRDPDALALRVGTAVLGSGFTGRLMSQVRDRDGLTYHIGAELSDDTFNDGSWFVEASFAPQLLDKGIAATRREIAIWWAQGITARELEAKKQGLIGRFYVGLTTTSGMASALLQAVQRGYQVSWLDEYPQAIEALTAAQVNASIKRHLDPARLVLVEAGTLP